MPDIKKLTDKELIFELNDIAYHIEHLGVGRYELRYQDALWREVEERGLEVNKRTIYEL